MELTSSAFSNGGLIPAKYTCNGENVSPPIQWSGAPDKTKSFALLMDDPDAPMGTVDHWVVFNIPASTTVFPEGITDYPEGVQLGRNYATKNSYAGPCPPDKEHRYFLKLYALDAILDLKAGVSKTNVISAMKGHVLAKAELMGRYDQPRK
ncbi:hypothetical protein AYO37_00395 [Opitutia bacterium SCGC AG-212-L18]|nr:hypothetical protein AYO37_00395 [Opitutae bacterium SCGC AG-212-L18]